MSRPGGGSVEGSGEMKARGLLACLVAFVIVPATMLVIAPPARAYGSTALWQIGFSFNCNDKTLCLTPPFGVGGFWGWVEFDAGGLGDATLTGCSHLSTSIGVLTGADHLNVDITAWEIGPSSMLPLPTFHLLAGTVTLSGVDFKGHPITVSLADIGLTGDTGYPAIPGHYSAQTVFGMSAPPGMNFEIQVVAL